MFTGLIQATGRPRLLDQQRLQISCSAEVILADLAIGDSVAVDGVCLTVEQILSQGFIVTVSPETLSRSTLQHQSERGAVVNLETALRVGSKLGGHFVTGHVDGLGQFVEQRQNATSWELRFTATPEIAPYIVSKGSIAVNGISLTVALCHPWGEWFEVAVIPHSFAQTNLRYLQPGALVNLEADLLGKYAIRALQLQGKSNPPPSTPSAQITSEFLVEHGYL
uniref:Riboflavin synthase n=1 Tax=Cyanothece sp. (strain PCC 7425 / ATCC 29141) TaxID=395961 RepID=B8HYP4_CYAP4